MYSPNIDPDHIEKMYRIRCTTHAIGEPQTMVDMVHEALEKYLPIKEREVNKKAVDRGICVIPAVPSA